MDIKVWISGLRGFSSAVGSDWNLHARKNPNTENQSDSNLPSSFMAENSRVDRNGLVSGLRSGTGRFGDRDCAEGDNPSSKVLQNEQFMCGRPPVRSVQMARLPTLPTGRFKVSIMSE